MVDAFVVALERRGQAQTPAIGHVKCAAPLLGAVSVTLVGDDQRLAVGAYRRVRVQSLDRADHHPVRLEGCLAAVGQGADVRNAVQAQSFHPLVDKVPGRYCHDHREVRGQGFPSRFDTDPRLACARYRFHHAVPAVGAPGSKCLNLPVP